MLIETMPFKVSTQQIFFTSDHHFFHHNIIKYSKRGFSGLEEMHEHFIKCWNSVVGENDIIFHLGDIFYGREANDEKVKWIMSRLNGHKRLILGNHDAIAINL